MMTRRIIRTLGQIAAFLILACILIFLADARYRVLPNSIHSALPSHHTGSVIIDVNVVYCSSANPFSSCLPDSKKWQRVEKDLYLGGGWVWSAYLLVQRKKEEELDADDQVVMDVKISRLRPELSEKDHLTESWESRPGGIYILKSSKRHDSDSRQAVTAIDVLFGPDAVDPRPGWELVQMPLLHDHRDSGQSARLSIRRGKAHTEPMPVPMVKKDGKFKILQISDAHLSTGLGVCRDAVDEGNKPSAHCDADPRTLDFIEAILDDEKPDMVVLSGDQVEGPAAPDTQTAIFKMTAPLIERSIPYAAIFGNHDDEGQRSMPRANQMALLQHLPYSLSQPGPEDIEGVGNYYVEVLAPGGNHHSALTLYMLDTHSLTPDEKHYTGYDWLKKRQIEWFSRTAQNLKPKHARYSHIHLDMAFIHIPIPEYADPNNVLAGGKRLEPVTAPGFNSHFYDALVDEGVVAVGCGHDHANDYCAQAKDDPNEGEPEHHRKHRYGPWLCYAGGSGFGGYGGYGGFHRRVRVYEVDTNAARISTWKRVECCGEDTKKRIDEIVLVEGGSVVPPPMTAE